MKVKLAQARTIDSYNFEDVDCIKIDVEGSELLVMQGAKEHPTLSSSVQVEIVQAGIIWLSKTYMTLWHNMIMCVLVQLGESQTKIPVICSWSNIGMQHRQPKNIWIDCLVPYMKKLIMVQWRKQITNLMTFGKNG